jgi:hypothetical protein
MTTVLPDGGHYCRQLLGSAAESTLGWASTATGRAKSNDGESTLKSQSYPGVCAWTACREVTVEEHA